MATFGFSNAFQMDCLGRPTTACVGLGSASLQAGRECSIYEGDRRPACHLLLSLWIVLRFQRRISAAALVGIWIPGRAAQSAPGDQGAHCARAAGESVDEKRALQRRDQAMLKAIGQLHAHTRRR